MHDTNWQTQHRMQKDCSTFFPFLGCFASDEADDREGKPSPSAAEGSAGSAELLLELGFTPCGRLVLQASQDLVSGPLIKLHLQQQSDPTISEGQQPNQHAAWH